MTLQASRTMEHSPPLPPPAKGGSSPSPTGVLELLARMAEAKDARQWAELRKEATQTLQELERIREEQKRLSHDPSVGRATYDRWVVELFQATESAVPRESLLRSFAKRFAELHDATLNENRDQRGPRVIILSYTAGQGAGKATIEGFYQRGLPAAQWKNFCARLAQATDDPTLRRLFIDKQRIEKWYLPYFMGSDYQGIFNTVLPAGKGQRNEETTYGPNAWLTAQPLFAEIGNQAHAVALLYPSEGKYFDDKEPPKSDQDLRVLDVLSAVYRQLEYQIKNLAAFVERARTEMLNQLGPGLMHHEIGGLTRNIHGSIADMAAHFARACERYDLPPELANEPERLQLLTDWSSKLIDTTDAFMNLERRGVVTEFPLGSLLAQVERLTVVRCGSIGARYVLDLQATSGLVIHNDATLLMHALLNIVNNALDAMQEQASKPPRRIDVNLSPMAPKGCISLDVVNTGPPIEMVVQHRIFDRGFTTRDQGHGQGLYLVRLVAQYCGGDVALIPANELKIGCNAGFRLWFAQQHSAKEEVGREL